MYDTVPQIESIVENGDGHNRFMFQVCSSSIFLNFFFLQFFHTFQN